MTLHLDDARWRAAVDAELRGEATPTQSELLAHYHPRGDEQRAEAAFLEKLREGPDAIDACTDETPTWLTAAVDAHLQSTSESRGRTTRARWPWLATAAALVLSTGLSIFALWSASQRPHELKPGQAIVVAPGDRSPSPAPIVAPSEDLPSEDLPSEDLPSEDTGMCVERPGYSICADAESQVTARSSGALALHSGTATVQTQDADGVRVELDQVTVLAAAHSVVVIERETAGWSVTVESGAATVTELGSARRLGAGESLQRGAKPSPRAELEAKPTVKASTLLSRARALRREGDPRGAMQTYAELIRKHPRSPAAQTARMSLAQLQLDQGSAQDALRSFRAYLEHGGALAEDAAYGEIRALQALGRSAEATRAGQAFRRRYPDSPYGAKLKP